MESARGEEEELSGMRAEAAKAHAAAGRAMLTDDQMLALLGEALMSTFTYEEKSYHAAGPHEQ
jgi:hypothetical protein